MNITKKIEARQKEKENSLNKQLIDKILLLEKEKLAAISISKSPQTIKIKTPPHSKSLSAVPFIIASDWHVEEEVKPATVNGLNSFNLKEADNRIAMFFNNSIRLLEKESRDIKVDTVVLALLGDFISSNIHEELSENCQLRPIEAIVWVQERLIAGIKLLLSKTKYDFVIVCHSGNHSRITKKIHNSTEAGNSLEYLMYKNIEAVFAGNKRIKMIVAEGYHSYLNLYGRTIRLHHGHGIKYGGGIGGIFIPTYKAIAQWNKAKKADLDIMGHFHQLKNGGNFICNGSLIGWSAYCVRIKADFERPLQKFFMFASNGFVIGEYPIFLEE